MSSSTIFDPMLSDHQTRPFAKAALVLIPLQESNPNKKVTKVT
jgi:hypothetical protein